MIKWRQNQYALVGTAGEIRLFAISYRLHSEDPMWTLKTELPGFDKREWKNDNQRVLMDKADSLLEYWISRVIGVAK